MVCTRVQIGGVTAIVCTSRPRFKVCACGSGKRATLLCDWKVTGKKSGTCDAAICSACATSPAADKDLCPSHARAWVVWRTAARGAG